MVVVIFPSIDLFGYRTETSRAALSAMRLAPQLGQNPRRSPKAPTFGATERDQVFMMTFGALHAEETVLQSTAFKVIGKFLLHMQGEC